MCHHCVWGSFCFVLFCFLVFLFSFLFFSLLFFSFSSGRENSFLPSSSSAASLHGFPQDKKIHPSAIVPDIPKEIVTFQFEEDLPIGEHILHIEFVGVLSDNLAGLYRSQYKVRKFSSFGPCTSCLYSFLLFRMLKETKNSVFVLKWSQPTVGVSSRVLMNLPGRPPSNSLSPTLVYFPFFFPFFSPFSYLIYIHIPLLPTLLGHMIALSNMPDTSTITLEDGRKKTAFEKSPPMASYLLALVVGEFDYVEKDTQNGVKV